MKGIQMFRKKGLYIMFISCFILMGIASLCDYQLSTMVFDEENPICIFLAAYGQLPVSLGMSILGTLLINVCKKELCIRSGLAILGGVMLNAMAMFMCMLEPSLYYEQTILVRVIVALVLLGSSNFLVLRYLKDVEKTEVIRFIKFGVFIIIAQLIIINLIKVPWGRPRMRMIAETPQASFQPWWIIGSSMKSSLMDIGVASEEFKSFPSGHTACATCILIFTMLPMMKIQMQKYVKPVFYAGLCFAIVVAFSRVVMGAHFLSDITIGFLVCYVIICIAYRHFYSSKIGGSYE